MMLKQLFAFVLGMGFVAVSALQYQGPNAPLWIGIFLAAAMLHFASALERTHTFVLWVAGACYFLAACYYWPGSAALTQGVVANDSAMRFWALVAASGTLLLQAFLFKKRSSLHPPHIPGHIPEMPRRWAN